ncbi:hypothetical protein AMTR_s00070p00158380 [Amborella trichopoda]|uniref:Uncharacterized protein n=1 Tax=Amborella trichopoda TaxID=13333 RepID=U5DJ70_AMBTC|nr:hypothetical protein AMTR_s00070p00158380 [Amborella trichopoda]
MCLRYVYPWLEISIPNACIWYGSLRASLIGETFWQQAQVPRIKPPMFVAGMLKLNFGSTVLHAPLKMARFWKPQHAMAWKPQVPLFVKEGAAKPPLSPLKQGLRFEWKC